MARTDQIFINSTILQDALESIERLGTGSITLKVYGSAIAEMTITEHYRFLEIDLHEKGGGI